MHIISYTAFIANVSTSSSPIWESHGGPRFQEHNCYIIQGSLPVPIIG